MTKQQNQSPCCPHEKALGPKLPTGRIVKHLTRLGRYQGWSESSLGARVISLVLSCYGANIFFFNIFAVLNSINQDQTQSCEAFDFGRHCLHLSLHMTTNDERQTKTQINLDIRPVWSESSVCALWVVKDSSFLRADSEDSDQTVWMPRLIWVIDGRTGHFVGFVMCSSNANNADPNQTPHKTVSDPGLCCLTRTVWGAVWKMLIEHTGFCAHIFKIECRDI